MNGSDLLKVLMVEGTSQGLRKRLKSLESLHEHEGENAKPSCNNCEFMKMPHEGHCYMFSEKPEGVPIGMKPCGQWTYSDE